MTLGITPLLSIFRNLTEITGFCVLFLLLDHPRFGWRRTLLYYAAFILSVGGVGTIWVLWDPGSYQKFCVLVFVLCASVFLIYVSANHPFQSYYNFSMQMFVLLCLLFTGIWCAKTFFGGNPWAELLIRIGYISVLAAIYYFYIRKPFCGLTEALEIPWRGACVVSVAGNLLVIYVLVWPVPVSFRERREQFIFVCMCILLLIMHIFMFRTLSIVKDKIEEQQEMELSLTNNKLLQRELELMQRAVEEARRIRHDIRHHNLNVAAYARKKDIKGLLDYLKEYEEEQALSLPVSRCENRTASNILSEYEAKARQKGIEVQYDLKLEQNIPVRDVDLIAILGNGMENALHGCLASGREPQRICVCIRPRSDKLAIRITNTCSDQVKLENGRPKAGGVGVSSILRSVKRYGGEADFKVQDGEFILRILLNISGGNEALQSITEKV